MRRVYIILFLLLAIVFRSAGQGRREDIFAQKLLVAVAKKDHQAFQRVSCSPRDLDEFLEALYKRPSAHNRHERKVAVEQFALHIDSVRRVELNSIVYKGEQLGVDWSNAQFVRFVFRRVKHEGVSTVTLTGNISFECNGVHYVLVGVEALDLSRGYKLTQIGTVQKGPSSE